MGFLHVNNRRYEVRISQDLMNESEKYYSMAEHMLRSFEELSGRRAYSIFFQSDMHRGGLFAVKINAYVEK